MFLLQVVVLRNRGTWLMKPKIDGIFKLAENIFCLRHDFNIFVFLNGQAGLSSLKIIHNE